MKKHIAIVGAGIVGATTAYFLARNGYNVTIFDREEGPALQCSKANGGQISVCNAETWNTWKNVWKGLKWLTQADAPLLVRPNMSFAKMKWLAGFLYETATKTHRQNTIDTILMGKRSSYLYSAIEMEEELNFDQSRCGMLHVYTNENSLDDAYESSKLFEEFGVSWRFLNSSEISAVDSKMKHFENVGGYYTDTDWVGDANKFASEILRVTVEKFGAVTRWNSEITDITNHAVWVKSLEHGTISPEIFDGIVICNGYEIAEVAKTLGDSLNVYPVKGYSITIDGAKDAPFLSLLDDDRKIVSSTLGSRLRVAGTAEIGDNDSSVREDRIAPLVKWVEKNFPTIDVNNRTEWACLRPMNANMMPIVKQSTRNPNVFYHGGHGHLGWTLAAATSEQLVRLVTTVTN